MRITLIIIIKLGKKGEIGNNYKIESIKDKYLNTISFEYNTDKQLTKIKDTLNREYLVSYNAGTRIQDITDFNGNKLEFVYFGQNETLGAEYDLKTIKMINGSSNKEIGFTYSVGVNYESSHNIIKLIDSENNTYVENSYNQSNRVLSQKYGNGTIYYDYTLDANNKIIQNSVTDRQGNIIDYYYDSNGNTTKKIIRKNSGDLEYDYVYDSNSNLIKEIKPLGNGVQYTYDANNNVIETRQKNDMSASGSTTDIVQSATYNQQLNKPTQIISPNGLITNFTYDTNGNIVFKQVLGVKDYEDNAVTVDEIYEYNTLGQLVKQTSASGLETSFVYGSGNLLKISKGTGENKIENTFVYDSKGNMVKSIDGKGNETSMSYNDFNLLTGKTTQEGISAVYSYNKLNKKLQEKIILGTNQDSKTDYTYDILDNLVKSIQEVDENTSLETNYIYDTNSRIIESNILNGAKVNYIYDENGLITQKKITYGIGANDNIITNYQYDLNERLIKEIIPNVSEINYEYDLFDRITRKIKPDGGYENYLYDKQNNITTKMIFNSNNVLLSKEEFVYDKLNQLTTTKKHIIENGESQSQITSYAVYNNIGKVTKTIDPKGNETNYTYDTFSRLLKTTDNLGNEEKLSYDKNNNVIQKQIIDSNDKTITLTYSYDSDNRLISETNNLNKTKTYEYNKLNQITSTTDEKGNTTNYEYNYSGKITKETKLSNTGNIITTYTYDNQGNLTKLIDANQSETNYTYDKLNRLIKQIYPDNNEINYTYDNRGNLLTKTDANGTTVTNNYDNQNRVISKNITLGTGVSGVTNETYEYDSLGRIETANDNNNHELNFNYDSLNRLTSETSPHPNPLPEGEGTATVSYTYDDNNNITNITNGANTTNKITNYTYDNLNRLTTIKQNNENIINYNYTGLENTSINYGNSVNTTKTYDDLMRLSTLNNGIKTYNYTYDDANNITSDNHKNYTYDDIYRITQVDNTTTLTELENFDYDNLGNRLTSYNQSTGSGANYSYTNNNLNQYTTQSGSILSYQLQEIVEYIETGTGETLTGTTVTTYTGSMITTNENIDYTYDNNGNLKQDNKYKYFYDYKNRLVKATNLTDETIAEFSYDVLNRRYKKETPEKETNYIYSNENILQEITTNKTTNTTQTKDYINGIGTDELLAYQQNEQTYYYHKNHLGSIDGLTDNNGDTIIEYEYDVFGKAKIVSGDETFENERLYTGREYDTELGLYYNRARYYNPETGRFVSRDPIDIKDDVNLYAYVGNNGVNFSDPSGMKSKTLIFWGEDYMSYESSRAGGIYNFKLKAEAYKEFLVKNGGYNKDNIIVADGTTFSNWQNALKNNGDINKIIYYGHSFEGGLLLGDKTPKDFSDNEIANLEMISTTSSFGTNSLSNYPDGTRDHSVNELYNNNAMGAEIELFGCNSTNMAEDFAKYFNGEATGSDNTIKFEKYMDSAVEFIPVIKPVNFFIFGVVPGGANGKTLNWDKYDFRK